MVGSERDSVSNADSTGRAKLEEIRNVVCRVHTDGCKTYEAAWARAGKERQGDANERSSPMVTERQSDVGRKIRLPTAQ